MPPPPRRTGHKRGQTDVDDHHEAHLGVEAPGSRDVAFVPQQRREPHHAPEHRDGAVIAATATVSPQRREQPDAQRRFRVVTNVVELQRALDYPWEKWTIFLHPAQRDLVEHAYNGPARVSGSAGTGKTVVALHRAVFLARKHEDARLLVHREEHFVATEALA